MVKRSFQERRKETNARYYQNRKAQAQGQQIEETEGDQDNFWTG